MPLSKSEREKQKTEIFYLHYKQRNGFYVIDFSTMLNIFLSYIQSVLNEESKDSRILLPSKLFVIYGSSRKIFLYKGMENITFMKKNYMNICST